MKHRLSFKLALIYGLIFILAVAVIDTALIFVYRNNQLEKNEKFYISLCSVLSAMAENNIKITNYINSGEGLAGQNNSRVLLLDTDGRVLLDSGGALSGTQITNQEFRMAALYGKPAKGYYIHEGKGMAMFSYPVTLSGRIGAVLLVSAYIQDIYDDINRFGLQITGISILVALIVIIASIFMGKRLSEPIRRLTSAAEEIYKGNIDTKVEIDRNDEIGILAGTFNKMSSELQKVEKGRKRFISDVSHELKTPLASIKALVEALLANGMDGGKQTDAGIYSESYNDECMEYLQDIDHEIDRLNGLVSSLLTSARLEEIILKKESLLLAEEVEGTIRALAPIAAQKNIRLENACDETAVIIADRNMLKEVLINLIDNAIKYGNENSHVRVTGDATGFSVADNGCGIPAEDLPYIFDSFYRVDKSRTGEGGSGIGLFIVKRIIELHDFNISVSSRLCEGTVFNIKYKKL